MNIYENITLRSSQKKGKNELPADSHDSSSSTLDGTIVSIPELSDDDTTQDVHSLKRQIETLNLKLAEAKSEINNLRSENTKLKKTVTELTTSPKSAKKRSRKTNSNVSDRQTPSPNTSRIAVKESKPPKRRLNKICIISTNKNNNILSISRNHFQHSEICHYLQPHVGIKQMLKNINITVKDYTKEDHCIILIGDEDFKTTQYYPDIVDNLRETLQSLTHTNIILCVPTYKYHQYSVWFNCRVESFNNLLYMDNKTYKYATLIDSNLDLSCDFQTFSEYNGSVKDHGMNLIFKRIKDTINYDTPTILSSTPVNDAQCQKPIEDYANMSKNEFFLV